MLADLLELVLPSRCGGCGVAGAGLCPACCALLDCAAQPIEPDPPPAGFPRCHAVAAYDGSVRAALIAYKERGRRDLSRPLGTALAASVSAGLSANVDQSVVLVPVPSRRRAVRQRGCDTTMALATEAARVLRRSGVDARVVTSLRLCRVTSDSAGLTAPARALNITSAMVARMPCTGSSRLVVVDDLLTTGATLAEAARALTSAGAGGVRAAVVAATPRRGLGFGARAR